MQLLEELWKHNVIACFAFQVDETFENQTKHLRPNVDDQFLCAALFEAIFAPPILNFARMKVCCEHVFEVVL